MERVVVFVSKQDSRAYVKCGCRGGLLQKFIPVCCTISTVVRYPVFDCKWEHNAGLILVATSCLLHLATKFLDVVLRVLQPSQYTSGIGKISHKL